MKRIAGAWGIRTRVLMSGSRRRPVAQARAAVGTVAVTGLGLTASHVTRALGVTPMAIRQGIDRGSTRAWSTCVPATSNPIG